MRRTNEDGLGLLCIPDITGFTRFMVETDLEFSRKIIPPLLRKIVSSNNLKMIVGEIEGDAVLFYRFGNLPSLKDIAEQCKTFYIDFNDQLQDITKEYAHDWEKNISSNRLSLKVVVHAAEMTSTHIGGIPKLIGEDVVVAHKLLKNSIQIPEYILMSEKFLANYSKEEIATAFNWGKLLRGKDEYEFIGLIRYRYITLTHVNGDVK